MIGKRMDGREEEVKEQFVVEVFQKFVEIYDCFVDVYSFCS